MTSSISESWTRIEVWLARHAPRTLAALGPPAERSAIAVAEQAIGQAFPEPLVESLLRHNGMGHYDLLPPFWSLLDVQSIINAWQTRMKIYGDELAGAEEGDPDGEYGPWWHGQWIPFAADGAGDYLIIDERSYRTITLYRGCRPRVSGGLTGPGLPRTRRWPPPPGCVRPASRIPR
ncbi:SMI1/KNR4 family protein [Streptomyces canus]